MLYSFGHNVTASTDQDTVQDLDNFSLFSLYRKDHITIS